MSGEPRQADSIQLERLILDADTSVRYYAALGNEHDRDRDLFAVFFVLVLVAAAAVSVSPLAVIAIERIVAGLTV